MLQGLDSLFPGILPPLPHCALGYSKCCCDVFLFPSLFMQFPRLHPSLFTPIFAGCRFFLHSSFYRIAQFRTLVLSAGIYNKTDREAADEFSLALADQDMWNAPLARGAIITHTIHTQICSQLLPL